MARSRETSGSDSRGIGGRLLIVLLGAVVVVVAAGPADARPGHGNGHGHGRPTVHVAPAPPPAPPAPAPAPPPTPVAQGRTDNGPAPADPGRSHQNNGRRTRPHGRGAEGRGAERGQGQGRGAEGRGAERGQGQGRGRGAEGRGAERGQGQGQGAEGRGAERGQGQGRAQGRSAPSAAADRTGATGSADEQATVTPDPRAPDLLVNGPAVSDTAGRAAGADDAASGGAVTGDDDGPGPPLAWAPGYTLEGAAELGKLGARELGLPVLLLVGIGGFLVLTGRSGRRAPRLTEAPVRSRGAARFPTAA